MITTKRFLTVAAILCFTNGCYRGEHREEQVTAENIREKYALIQNGMEYTEVVTLLGLPDSSSADLSKGPAAVLSVWNVDLRGGIPCHFLVQFDAGKVIAKDLRSATAPKNRWPADPPEPSELSKQETIDSPTVHRLKRLTADDIREKYGLIQNGMEFSKIVTLLGRPRSLRRSGAEEPGVVVGYWDVEIRAGLTRQLTIHFEDGKAIAKDMRGNTAKDGSKQKEPPKPPARPKPSRKPEAIH